MENNENQSENENPTQKQNTFETTYKTVSGFEEQKAKFGFGKTVVLPFFCGVVGTAVVIGTCFGIPQIREKIVGNQTVANTESATTSGNNLNTNLVSLANYSDTGVGVANKVRPSIVGIKVEYVVNSLFNTSQTATASGSGIIISEDGYILTNNHIVNSSSSSSFYELGKASKVTITLYNDETAYEAKIVGTDEQTDLAVLKIEKTGLTAAELGDSDSIQVGEFSMAIGNPLGLNNSVTAGIISAVDRKVTDSDGKTFTLIQTDAAINSGNSGGALVNSKGQVIGVNTLKLQGTGVEGMGFAIPINATKDITAQLIQYSKVKRPYIGITGIDLDQKTAEYNKLVVGIYIKEVEDFSAAQKGGLKVGDVIIEADGTKVTTMDELNKIKNSHKIGDELKLKVNRNGQEKEIVITLAEQP
ncbi:MAG: S1C family serine protease [Clostridia bacterium]